jgi:hypothetical protein
VPRRRQDADARAPGRSAPAEPVPAQPLAVAGDLGLMALAGRLTGGGAALARAHAVAGLQGRYGNRAVARTAGMLARQMATRDEKLAAWRRDVAKGEWGDAAERLNGFDDEDIQRLLAGLSKQQLRKLDAGALRQIPGFAGRVHGPIMAKLGKGPGATFGKLTFIPGSPVTGGPMTNYCYPVDFSFKPDADVVRATEIAYVQTVKLVDIGSGDTKDWQPESRARQTDDKWAVDRSTGVASGYAGYTTGAQPGTHVTQWTDAAPDGFATYHDEPGAQISNTSWDFETAVVAKAGADEGVIYASCSWGFTVDDRLQPTPKATKIEDKPSKAFYAAADKWNQQAGGPAAGRNTPTQEALPAMR